MDMPDNICIELNRAEMNTNLRSVYQSPRRLYLLSLFAQFTNQQTSGCLYVEDGTTTWMLYLHQGLLVYASNSLDPFGRIERYIDRLSQMGQGLPDQVWEQVRLMFESSPEDYPVGLRDYEAICWLANQEYLDSDQTTSLVKAIAEEVVGALLLVQKGSYELTELGQFGQLPRLYQINLRAIAESFQNRLLQQRAASRSTTSSGVSAPASHTKDKVHPHTSSTTRNQPTSPRLNPGHRSNGVQLSTSIVESSIPIFNGTNGTAPSANNARTATHRIVCVDDSLTILKAVEAFLDDPMFEFKGIADPLNALMEVIRHKPDVILLDITMPNLDGYEFCSLLRRHESFKHVPIIMLTGNTGIIDRARAKFVGASGYLTKPFGQSELLKIVLKHLSY